MEKYAVKKLNKKNNINASVPGSKSITNRALMLAAMSDAHLTVYCLAVIQELFLTVLFH